MNKLKHYKTGQGKDKTTSCCDEEDVWIEKSIVFYCRKKQRWLYLIDNILFQYGIQPSKIKIHYYTLLTKTRISGRGPVQ